MTLVMVLQLLIVLGALWVGSRYGSLALGAISGIGLAILVFGFTMKPGSPPTDVIYIIIAAVTCAGIMQASGGMDWLIQIAEKMLRKHPAWITFLAPLCTFFLTVLVGTGHVVYTLMPIICDIAINTLDKEIPQSAKNAVYVFLGALLIIVFFAIFQDVLPSYSTIKAIKDAPDFTFDNGTVVSAAALAKAKVVIPGITEVSTIKLKMNVVIQIVMITAAAIMIIFCKASPVKAVHGAVWQSGMVAVVAIFGIAWLADTFFSNYTNEMQTMLGDIVAKYNWSIAIVFFLVSVLINSQGAVVVSMLPLAYSLGIPGPVLLGVLPSVYGYFFIPNYPSDIATVNFDRSGTTIIGKYLLNHSFMMPGLIHITVATLVAYGLSSIIF